MNQIVQAAKAAATKQRPPSWPKTQFVGHEGGLGLVAVALAACTSQVLAGHFLLNLAPPTRALGAGRAFAARELER